MDSLFTTSCHHNNPPQPGGGSQPGDEAREQRGMALTSDGGQEVTKGSTLDIKPAGHSIATQTSPPPSAAATFFIRSLVRIAGSKSGHLFPVHVGLRQGCPLSPVLFIIFMDRISRRSQGPEGVRFGNHRISSLLFMQDDVVLMASSGQDLQHVLERFAAECEAAGMRISTSKSEAMVLDWKRVACPLRVSGEVLPQVEESSSMHLGSQQLS
ncbi:hypothetical protein L3Q82_001584 [Scortum barcoo]|uniref:Uncharacterized protein n=1 Tax=Scortum barcoo TaxID=214431 RepID=A0ACB8W8C1_9TELE|nr:hypothetical protein L3Q82_001584 [Scortum barcoo]